MKVGFERKESLLLVFRVQGLEGREEDVETVLR
jgi:hypothetical protein